MHHILLNTEPIIIKTKLAPFIVNNLYCNYLSGNYIDNNLLYLLTIMLKDEIDKLENINQVDTFLENTKCGILLEELRNIPDIQIFFKNVIYNVIERMERLFSFREINFDVSEIIKELNKTREMVEKKEEKNIDEVYKKIINSKLFDPSINYYRKENDVNQNDNDTFMSKYITDLTNKEFENLAEKAKNDNKNDLYQYFIKYINDMKINDDNNLYSNKILMKDMLETKLATYMLLYYKNNFLNVISFIKEIIQNLMQNILLLPNSIKSICKIISILIRNKFKDITKAEENTFISQFIIGKLLIPFLSFPSQNALISEFIISENTIKNIGVVNYILKKLFLGKFFHNNLEDANFTPFNWFFIEEIEHILELFEKITIVKIPDFIDKLINDKLPSDFTYDFFEENKEEFCAHISICFTIDDLEHLIKGFEKCDSLFSNNTKNNKLKRAYTKLKSEAIMNEIKQIDNKLKKGHIDSIDLKSEKSKKNEKRKEKEKEKEKEKSKKEKEIHYLYNELLYQNNYINFFSMNNNITYFNINLKQIQNNRELDENEKNIIKIKNYLCSSLGNFRLLNKSDFNIDETSNIEKILNEIKNYMSLPNFILNNNTIPSIWYINSILYYLKRIPEDYKKDDYKKLFNELTENLNDSINTFDFEKLILLRNKSKFIDKMNNLNSKLIILKNNNIINDNIKKIVEKVFIPIDITFNYDEEEGHTFQLEKSKLKEKNFEDKIIYEEPKKKYISFKTIEAFTRYFPNLTLYQDLQDVSTLEIIKELSINQKINKYYEFIKEKLIKKNLIELDKYNTLYKEKIKDYIMNKLYDKIYPIECDSKDTKIFQKTIALSWVEPQLIIKKDYIFDDMLPDILNEFKQINIVKNPLTKLDCMKKIMLNIQNIIKFNEGEDKEIGAEDITPVLNYVFIKAQPLRIFSDIEFTKLFCENSGQFENSLVNFESMCLEIKDCSNQSFNMSPEEFKKRCEDATNNDSINH